MILPEKLTKLFKEKVGFYSCTVPSFDQFVLAEFIEHGNLSVILIEYVDINERIKISTSIDSIEILIKYTERR